MSLYPWTLAVGTLVASVFYSVSGAAPAPQGGDSLPSPAREAAESAPKEDPARAYARDFLDEFTRAKLRKNGEYLFCDQPGYLDCYKVSREQCLGELAPLKDSCLTRADEKFPDRMVNEKDIDRYASYFSVCMMLQHSARKDAREIGACLRNVDWDKAQRDRSLLK